MRRVRRWGLALAPLSVVFVSLTAVSFAAPTRQTGAPPRSVRMNARGTYRVCNGQTCLGNPPQGVPALPYGRSIRVGGFRCSSARRKASRWRATRRSDRITFGAGKDGL